MLLTQFKTIFLIIFNLGTIITLSQNETQVTFNRFLTSRQPLEKILNKIFATETGIINDFKSIAIFDVIHEIDTRGLYVYRCENQQCEKSFCGSNDPNKCSAEFLDNLLNLQKPQWFNVNIGIWMDQIIIAPFYIINGYVMIHSTKKMTADGQMVLMGSGCMTEVTGVTDMTEVTEVKNYLFSERCKLMWLNNTRDLCTTINLTFSLFHGNYIEENPPRIYISILLCCFLGAISIWFGFLAIQKYVQIKRINGIIIVVPQPIIS